MAITANKLLSRVKLELDITNADRDTKLLETIEDALAELQEYKCKTLVDTVTNAATEVELSRKDIKFIKIYCALWLDDNDKLQDALAYQLEKVRNK